MQTIRIENKLVRIVELGRSKFRSLVLFGNPNKVIFGKKVRLEGNIRFGNNITIRDYSHIRGNAHVVVSDNVFIHENVLIRSKEGIQIGKNTTINRNVCILTKVSIGENCSIAPNVVIVGSIHHIEDASKTIKEQGTSSKGIVIEDDVWIAANATVLDGVRIGKGSVVGAGSVVTHSVEPYSIVAGSPAKLIRKRE